MKHFQIVLEFSGEELWTVFTNLRIQKRVSFLFKIYTWTADGSSQTIPEKRNLLDTQREASLKEMIINGQWVMHEGLLEDFGLLEIIWRACTHTSSGVYLPRNGNHWVQQDLCSSMRRGLHTLAGLQIRPSFQENLGFAMGIRLSRIFRTLSNYNFQDSLGKSLKVV